jgi:hypothetical protein
VIIKSKRDDGVDAQGIQECRGPKSEVLEVLVQLVPWWEWTDSWRWRKADPQGCSESGLQGPSPFLSGTVRIWKDGVDERGDDGC